MAGLSREEYDAAAVEIGTAWGRAGTRDEGLRVIVDLGRKYGYKNVMAVIQGRTPKRFENGQALSEWIEDRHREEG